MIDATTTMTTAIEAILWVALGFVPAYLAMEGAWRMGRIVGRRGEPPKTLLKKGSSAAAAAS